MDRFNIQAIEFNVKPSLVLESQSRPRSALRKSKSSGSRPTSASAPAQRPTVGDTRTAENMKLNANPNANIVTERPQLPSIKPSNSSAAVARPQSAQVHSSSANQGNGNAGNITTSIPIRKSIQATATVGPQSIRTKEQKATLRSSVAGGRVFHREAWDCTTSGLRRDLLQIAQDEMISSVRAKNEGPPPPSLRPRPLSAVDARLRRKETDKGKAGTVKRERLAAYMRFNRSHGHGSSNSSSSSSSNCNNENSCSSTNRARWSAQTFTDENDDRARPTLKSDFRSHAEFTNLMDTLRKSSELTRSASSKVFATPVAREALAPSVVFK